MSSRSVQTAPHIVQQRPKTGMGFAFDAVDFPVSANFAIFLDSVTQGGVYHDVERDWGDQVTEHMSPSLRKADMAAFRQTVQRAADKAFLTPLGRNLVLRAYHVLAALMAGNRDFMADLQGRNRFIFVVSAPRHGGSYLTKELLRALGKDYRDYPAWFMHDGFPDIRQAWLSHDGMEWLPMTRRAMQQTAEWIVMADWFFRDDPQRSDRDADAVDGVVESPRPALRTIPKKATKAIYEARFFRDVFGMHAEYVVPVRHPAAACLSLVEKAGGMPENGLFPQYPRSSIEGWVLETWAQEGVVAEAVAKMPYFTAYLHYWLRYHEIMATNGLFLNNRKLTLLPYTQTAFEGYLQRQHDRFRSGCRVEPMHIHSKVTAQYPQWLRQSESTLDYMESVWASFGVRFPRDAVAEAL